MSQPPSALHFRHRLRLLAGFTFALILTTAGTGQTPPKGATPPVVPKGYEEEVDPNWEKVPKKKLFIEEEGPPPVTVPKGAFYVRIVDLDRAANEAKDPAVKALLAKYVVGFDLLEIGGAPIRITPIPIHRSEKFPDRFGIFELTPENAPRLCRGVDLPLFRKIDFYEEMVLKDVEPLADLTPGLRQNPYANADPGARLAAAERLLAAAVYFHDGARDQNKRRGKGWEEVKQKLDKQLAAIRVKRIKLAAERKEWAAVRALGSRMATLYPHDAELLKEVYLARLAEAETVIASSEQASELERGRDILADFESRYPGAKAPAAEKVREAMKQKSARLFTRAEIAVKTDAPDARNLLRLVEILDPEYPGLRELQAKKVGYTVLYVAVDPLPDRMSPAMARFDSEHMAVELMFEGLLDAIPDETHGVHYLPALAAAMPAPGALVRDVPLTSPVEWGGEAKGQLFDATDVAGTLKMLREYRQTWASYGIDWLEDQVRVEDLRRVRLGFHTGHPYPLSLLSFKLLPARYLAAKNKGPGDVEFTLQPFGTGPFRLKEKKPGEVVFVSNATYARRPGRLGQPYIKEVRFVSAAKYRDPVVAISDFKGDKLHILTDVPTADLAKFTAASAGLQGKVTVATAAANRRIQILAVNHRKPVLQSPALRRGIAHAIDRDEILRDVFRAGYEEYHRPLAGPFPPKSWATPKPLGGEPPRLFNRDLAQGKFAEQFKKFGAASLTLFYPAGDPRAKAACDRIKRQVESVAVTEDGKLTLTLEPLPLPDLYRRVYEEQAFDLAYVPFEFPDDLYPLGLAALTDPTAAGRGGRNFMGCLVKQNNPSVEDETVGRLLGEAKAHADPAKLAQKGQEVFTRFNEAMPFIPLWQLDRHMVISTAVKLAFDGPEAPQPKWLPPRTLFAGVGKWRLE
jgi:ABC-type transport system substrate-binding protein